MRDIRIEPSAFEWLQLHVETGCCAAAAEAMELSDVTATHEGILVAAYAVENEAFTLGNALALREPGSAIPFDAAGLLTVAEKLERVGNEQLGGVYRTQFPPLGMLGSLLPEDAGAAVLEAAHLIRAAVKYQLSGHGDRAGKLLGMVIPQRLKQGWWAAEGRTRRCQAEEDRAMTAGASGWTCECEYWRSLSVEVRSW